MAKKYAVYCRTEKEICGHDDLYLGMAALNEPLRCGRCGRYTCPGIYKKKNYQIKKGND